MNTKQKYPFFIVPKIPYLWGSHKAIRPAFVKHLHTAHFPIHFEEVWIPGGKPSREFIERIKKNASCLVFPFSLEHCIPFLANLRNHGALERVPAIMVVAGELSRGGYEIIPFRRLFHAHDHFVAYSTTESQFIRAAFPKHKNIHVIPLAVLKEEMNVFDKKISVGIKKELGLGPSDKIVLYAGRISIQKNIHGLIWAFAQTRKKHPHAHLVIAGDQDEIGLTNVGLITREGILYSPTPGQYLSYLARLVSRMGLEKHIHFVGGVPRTKLLQYFNACDVHASLTLHREDFGYSMAEGMHCGAPTLITKWGGGLDFVVGGGAHGVDVAVTEFGPRLDYHRAVEALTSMLTPPINNLWRTAALEFISSHLSERKILSLWEKLLLNVQAQTVNNSPVAMSSHYLANYLFHLSKKNLWRKRNSSPSIKVLQSQSDPFYLWSCRVYGGADSRKNTVLGRRRKRAYLHPFFSIEGAIVDDPLIHLRELSLTAKDKKHLKNIFGARGERSANLARIKSLDCGKMLIEKGIILFTDKSH